MHFSWLFSSDSLDEEKVTTEEDTSMDYGTVTLDFRF